MIRMTISAVFLIAGFVITLISAIGILKFPDFLTRLHASSVGESMGIVLMGTGFVIYEGADFVSVKIILTALAVFLVNPVGTHLISKSALRNSTIRELETGGKYNTVLEREEIDADFSD